MTILTRTLAGSLTCLVLLCCSSGKPEKHRGELKITARQRLAIPEPSDVALDMLGGSLHIVSDNGLLYKTRLDGSILKQAPVRGYDFEGVYQEGGFVYVMEERSRKILKFDTATYMQEGTYGISYSGGRNKGFECLAYNPSRKTYLTITEKDPTVLYELSHDFTVKNEVPLFGYPDISSATFYAGKLWILSDEGQSVTRVDPATYAREASWSMPILNPEGLYFDQAGTLHVVSDDRAILYTLGSEELTK